MKKMTKKWDLEISNAETELKIGIYAKNWAKQVMLKFFDYGQSQRSKSMVRVNGQSQQSTDDMCWRGSVTSPRADVVGREAQQARVARKRVAGTDGVWRRVWCNF